MTRDPRPDYIYTGAHEHRAIDFAHMRQLSHSLRPASLIGPALAIVVILAGVVLAYSCYTLAQPVTP